MPMIASADSRIAGQKLRFGLRRAFGGETKLLQANEGTAAHVVEADRDSGKAGQVSDASPPVHAFDEKRRGAPSEVPEDHDREQPRATVHHRARRKLDQHEEIEIGGLTAESIAEREGPRDDEEENAADVHGPHEG
jgi:hypothetical protein